MPIWLSQFREVFRPSRINCLFMNMLRGYLWSLPEEDLKDLRANYAAAISNSSSWDHCDLRYPMDWVWRIWQSLLLWRSVRSWVKIQTIGKIPVISVLYDDTIHMVACSTDVETSLVSVCNVGGELKPSSRVQKKLDDLCGHWTEEHGELEGFHCQIRSILWTLKTLWSYWDVAFWTSRLLSGVQIQVGGCVMVVSFPGEDVYIVGVHKRLACSEMVACQLSQRAPSNAEYILRARKLFATSERRKILFLATDDSQVQAPFRRWQIHRFPFWSFDFGNMVFTSKTAVHCSVCSRLHVRSMWT